jgi:MFS family permease
MGFDRAFIGHVGGIAGIVSMVLLYPAGMLADRFHPLRMLLIALTISLFMAPLSIAFVFTRGHFTLHTAEMIAIALSAITLPIATLATAAEFPMFMKLLPQERYGQFCSANALIRSVTLVGAGLGCGYYLDYMKRFSPNPDDCYRFLPFWTLGSSSAYLFFIYLLYREWKRLGGLAGYVPPSAKPPESVIDILEQQPE